MASGSIRQMADQVSYMMEDRLGVRGQRLSDKLRQGGHKLPRKVRRAATLLAEADELAMTPKLHARVDEARVAAGHRLCVRYLGRQKSAKRAQIWADMGASVGFAALVVLIGFVAYLVWKGHV